VAFVNTIVVNAMLFANSDREPPLYNTDFVRSTDETVAVHDVALVFPVMVPR
jgi:hypothetical protein